MTSNIEFVKVEAVIDFETLATILIAEDRNNRDALADIRDSGNTNAFMEYLSEQLIEPMQIEYVEECLQEFLEIQFDS